MKSTRSGSIAASIIVTQAILVSAQVATNPPRLVPTSNLEAARSRFPLSDLGRIATNTPAFEEYGVNFMLAKANETREKWKLEIPKPLTVNDVLFQLKATVRGLDGGLGTRDKRYSWGFERNTLTDFDDKNYWPRSFRYPNDDQAARLGKIKSQITAQEAETIARNVLHSLGLNERELRLKEPPMVNQYKFEESDGTVFDLPMFNVAWRSDDDPEPEGDEFVHQPVRINVSGITKKVAEYFNACRRTPPDPLATNYFQMLGLPTNYLETLPERTRRPWGLPPLTNAAPPSANPSK